VKRSRSSRRNRRRQRDNRYVPRIDDKQLRLPFKDFIDSTFPSSPSVWDVEDLPHPPRKKFHERVSLPSFHILSNTVTSSRLPLNTLRDVVCRRRRERRSVLFATNVAGFGIRGPFNKVYTLDSAIKCFRR
jgi:hypothetical protein